MAYDPDDTTDIGSLECWGEIHLECGLGFELALVLPPLLWLRRRGRRA